MGGLGGLQALADANLVDEDLLLIRYRRARG